MLKCQVLFFAVVRFRRSGPASPPGLLEWRKKGVGEKQLAEFIKHNKIQEQALVKSFNHRHLKKIKRSIQVKNGLRS